MVSKRISDTLGLAMLTHNAHFAPLIKKYGPPNLKRYHGRIGLFEALLRSIIYQQISGKAAASIHRRLLDLFPRHRAAPESLLKLKDTQLRAAGLSASKVMYAQDLAKRFLDGTIDTKRISRMSSSEIIEHLCIVKGIGEWTAHMVLIFTLHRPDILPVGDLAIRKGFQKLYGLKQMPNRKEMEELARPWRSSATAASWYLWRIVDEPELIEVVTTTKMRSQSKRTKTPAT